MCIRDRVNVAFLSVVAGVDQINILLADPLIKAASAVPGNVVLLLAALLIYRFRTCKGNKDELVN